MLILQKLHSMNLDFTTLFDGIAIKPGKPTVFGKINNTFILNLPGNPFSLSALIFEMFGKLIVKKLLASNDPIYHNYIETKISHEFKIKRKNYVYFQVFLMGQVLVLQKRDVQVWFLH